MTWTRRRDQSTGHIVHPSVVLAEHGHVPAADVAEHGVEDGHAVGSDHADSTELLDQTDEHDDQEGFVHLGVAPDVPHVVTLALLVLSDQDVQCHEKVFKKLSINYESTLKARAKMI